MLQNPQKAQQAETIGMSGSEVEGEPKNKGIFWKKRKNTDKK